MYNIDVETPYTQSYKNVIDVLVNRSYYIPSNGRFNRLAGCIPEQPQQTLHVSMGALNPVCDKYCVDKGRTA